MIIAPESYVHHLSAIITSIEYHKKCPHPHDHHPHICIRIKSSLMHTRATLVPLVVSSPHPQPHHSRKRPQSDVFAQARRERVVRSVRVGGCLVDVGPWEVQIQYI